MNWKEATLAQLYEIAYNDAGCKLSNRIEAAAELKRRNKEKLTHTATQEKIRRKRA